MMKIIILFLTIFFSTMNCVSLEITDSINNDDKVKVIIKLSFEKELLVARVEFHNISKIKVGIPIQHLIMDNGEIIQDLFEIKNENNIKAEYIGDVHEIGVHYYILKSGQKTVNRIVLNRFYKLPKANKYYTVKYDFPFYKYSNIAKIYVKKK